MVCQDIIRKQEKLKIMMSNVLTVCPPIKLAIMLKKLKLKMMVMRFFTL